jgi:hypothetical protein
MSKAIDTLDGVPHPSVKDSRVLTYLEIDDSEISVNTKEENELVQLWRQKYVVAKAEYEASRCNSKKVKQWRDAYEGIIHKIDPDGTVTEELVTPLRRVAYELVEEKVNPRIPAPKMSPRYHADLTPVSATESLLRHEMNKMLSEETHDESEHSTLIDSTSWFKVNWNPFDNTHERSGMPTVSVCPVDTVFPQPGIYNYKELEYIFEESKMTPAQVKDLFDKVVTTGETGLVDVVTCYFLNEDRHLGRFMWTEPTLTVLSNDLEWGIRRRRECSKCHNVTPIQAECPICGSKNFKYVPVTEEILEQDLVMVKNPYRSGETTDASKDKTEIDESGVIPAGTRIPHYLIRQIPFVPRRTVKLARTIYGISEVELIAENQEMINQFLNKAKRKSAASKTLVTKLKDTAVTDDSGELTYLEIESAEEGHAVQSKQIMADISEEMAMAENMYANAKSTIGVTNTDQGKEDPTARSGKAKQIQMAASQQRKQAPGVMRDSAYAGVYELLFKFMLAFSDEERSFVSLLPDGTQMEQVWSKYMFLSKDENGDFYYRDDFAWSVDNATEITQDRAAMWQLIDQDYLNGTMGNEIDPLRALKMYWQMKEQFGYPTAKYALAFLNDSVNHLPTQIEQMLLKNPEALQLAMSFIQDSQRAAMGGGAMGAAGGVPGQRGGARPNSGPDGNNATHAANVEKTNNKNRAQSGNAQTTTQATSQGGMQGGTGGAK